MGFELEREDSLVVEHINPNPHPNDMPNSHSNSFNGAYPTEIEDKTRLEEIDTQSKEKEEKEKNGDAQEQTHILEGTTDFALPNAFVQGTNPPLTARPYQLSRGFSHLVAAPEKHREVIAEKMANLQSTLAQLGSDDLKQAKADIVYLKAILDDEGPDIAQIKAGANWASRDA
ncbi:uncharacterized protein I303_104519 [Kwoniella dejecticola CBS 10117]|uniref:Uncharacterized protein n=1 Tax=Kwoniella dejecticola CBS 10117 TaxID=1296121 RepID=A0A1A6A531_9TREE|nr:uncharacterized protein I303_04504 [Kwoniella dejecticola CBS 10117]OBR85172.1 hypothetical protein I303_04504 [Kwoniella dejecticola CBS 10117]